MLYRSPILALIFFLYIPVLVLTWCKQTYLKTGKQIRTMATSLGGRYLAVAHVDNYVRFYYGDSYSKAGEYNVGFSINVIRFSNDGYYLAVGGASGSVTIINAYEPFGYNTTVNPNVGSNIIGIDFSNASNLKFLACGRNTYGVGKVNLMNIVHGTTWSNANNNSMSMNLASSAPNDCRLSPFDGKIIVNTDSKLQLYDAGLTANSPITWNANGGISYSKLVFNPLSANVLFIDSNGNQTYSLATTSSNTTPVALSSLTTSVFSAIDFSPTGKYIATGGAGKILYIYDSSRTVIARWDTSSLIKAIAFSRNNPNQRLFVGDFTGEILVLSFNCSALTCPTDYYLDPTGCKFCGDAISKCISCSNQTICQSCIDGYFINPNTFKCDVCTMLGCLTCNSAINCTECHSGFYSVTANNFTTCKRCTEGIGMEGCAICNASDTCIACNNDYYIDSVTTPLTHKCKLCNNISNCLKCYNDTVCVECMVGYYKNGNGCLACHTNCLACEAVASNCTQCAQGWYANMPTSYTCTRCATGCLSCNNSNFCFECQNGMYEKTDGTCATCVFPCAMCQDSTVCYACSEGYFLSGTSCSPCINNCATCNSSAYCTTCLTGYYNFTGNVCKGCFETFPFCEYCNSSACQSCQLGYFLNSSSLCQYCSEKMFKCEKCSSDTNCISCIEGFYLAESTGKNSCQSCKIGCQACKNSGNCRKCFRQYYLDANFDCIPCVGNCLQCIDSSNCEVCDLGYYLDGEICNFCSVNLTNCLLCSSGTACVDCEIGYYLSTSDQKCKRCTGNCVTCDSSKCLSCQIAYYLTTDTSPICSLCSQKCSECTATTCTSCKAGYYLDTGLCKNCSIKRNCHMCNVSSCNSCLYGYYLDNTISPPNFNCTMCQSKIQGCLDCNASNYCMACDYGYYLDIGTNLCVSCTAMNGCEKCQDSSTCQLCGPGFFLNSTNKCQSCQLGCSTCDISGSCFTCSPGFYLNGTNCVVCKTYIEGCSLCSTSTTCVECMNGYYLQTGPSQCNLCRKSLVGCLYCNGNSVCTNCQPGFYLNAISSKCETCDNNMAGCEVCSASNVCLDCGTGYYLTGGGESGCTLCSSNLFGCLSCTNINTCLRCKTGFYLYTESNCKTCFTINSGCQLCSPNGNGGILCTQCSSGFSLDLTTSLCVPCTNIGCKLCDQTDPSVCITCDLMYYKSGNNCQKCSSVIQGCNECSSTNQCITCDVGYYLETGVCKLCQNASSGCSKCEYKGGINGCTECKSSYTLDSVKKNCTPCSQVLEGCTYCVNTTACVSCSNGYFKDSTTNLCRSCTQQQGCILCSDQTSCEYCAPSFFLDHSQLKCTKCSSVFEFCITCLQSTRCLNCESGYFVNEKSECEQITVKATTKPDGVKLITEFVDKETLIHTLMVANDQYSNVGCDLTGLCTLYLTDYNHLSNSKKIVQIQLVIKDVQWISPTKIRFYTDNPTSLSADKMSLVRRLSVLQKVIEIKEKYTYKNLGKRLLAEQGGQNMGNFKVSLEMSQQAINTILPNVYQTGDLVLDYSLSEPEFYTSYLKSQSANSGVYSYFGYAMSGILILNFIAKTYRLSTNQNTHHSTGEILGHVFALKSIFLFQYPITQEFYYFCYGFMMPDLPWLNYQIGSIFGEQADYIPKKLAMYFYNLNIASTYLLALGVAILLLSLRFVISKTKEQVRTKYTELIYGIFMFGMTFAGSLAIQGAKFNPIQKISVNGVFYLIGIVLYFAIFIEMLYSVHKNKQNFYRVRIFAKATLLSIGHLNPIIIVSMSIILDIFLVVLQYIVVEHTVAWRKIWLVNHLLLDIALALTFFLPNSLLSLYGCMAIVGIVTLIEILLNFKMMRYCEQMTGIKNMHDEKAKNHLEHTRLGFVMNESLETFIDDKDYNKFDMWNVEYAGGQIGTLNEIALQDQRVDTVKKQFQQNTETKYFSFLKGFGQRPQQNQEQMNEQVFKQNQKDKKQQKNRRSPKKLVSRQTEEKKKKQLNPFRIESSSSSPTDESAPSVEEKNKPKSYFVQGKNRQKRRPNPLS